MARVSQDRLCVQCSAAARGQRLPDWTVQLQKTWPCPCHGPYRSFRLGQRIPKWPSLCTGPLSSSGRTFPAVDPLGRMVVETLSICLSAALSSHGGFGGKEWSAHGTAQHVDPAEPGASGAEHGEQGAGARGTEAIHVRGVAGGRLWTQRPWFPAPGLERAILGVPGQGDRLSYRLTLLSLSLEWF